MKYSLTGAVSDGYLYGGAFDNENCTANDVHDFGRENAMSFTPVKGSTYYIWEVPERYLVPRTYSVAHHDSEHDGQFDVIKLFLLTVIDRNEYKELGFTIVDDDNYISTYAENDTGSVNDEPVTYGVVSAALCG